MKLTLDKELNVVRNIGEDAPGVLMIAYPESRATFVVDTNWTPPARLVNSGAGGIEVLETGETGLAPTSTAVDVADVVAGIFSEEVIEPLWKMAVATYFAALEIFLAERDFDACKSGLALIEDLYAELVRRREILADWEPDS